MWRNNLSRSTAVLITILCWAGTALAQDRPNILVIWGDDIGLTILLLFAYPIKSPRSASWHETCYTRADPKHPSTPGTNV